MDEEEIQDIFMQDLEKYPVLSEEEQQILLKKYKNDGNKESYKKLVTHNLGLAVMVANRYTSRCKTMSFLDLIQENCLILMTAIETYDVNNQNAKFSTYATKAMKQTLQRKIDEKDDCIKISSRSKIASRKYDAYVTKCLQTSGKKPLPAEIKDSIKISKYRMDTVENMINFQPVSLEKTIKNNTNSHYREIITLHDIVGNNQSDYLAYEQTQDFLILIRSIADFLTKEEYYTFYYREISTHPKTLKQVGDELGVREETIRIRQKRILEKLKPAIEEIQAKTIAKYGLNDMDKSELIPLEPKKRLALYFLKQNMDELSYQMIYTKLCDIENDKISYYQNKFPEEPESKIKKEHQEIIGFMKEFFTTSVMEKIYEEEKKDLTISEILELNIKPERADCIKEQQISTSLDETIESIKKPLLESSTESSFSYQKVK